MCLTRELLVMPVATIHQLFVQPSAMLTCGKPSNVGNRLPSNIHTGDEKTIEEHKPITFEDAPVNSLPNISIKDNYSIYTTFGVDPSQYGPEIDENGNTYHEIAFPDSTAKLITDSQPPLGHTARLRVY